ncbi:BnaA09g48260D [Brassica napus]|uniref:BnaA09g48260D protein n=1 Tax=Brassica napus TaxID=3708 RepID=A0A078H8T8_BRANA|nr:BnaA09g48260D [Brassica napus]
MSPQFRRDRSRFNPQQTWVSRVTITVLVTLPITSTKGVMLLLHLHLIMLQELGLIIAKELHLILGL